MGARLQHGHANWKVATVLEQKNYRNIRPVRLLV
ncbi:hypothetical protein CY0110_15647 [Crocosphaera chwakensis CCY0110]|uniref:Uncharacterized protein n=1 Tax=Crocosphaera chwakensis CCY0110 TaxID=391612 RepID=A3IHG1_9CHRO|nr:hypothetical protein CY0110_15647 [Crocosphaera chwakensis CCY0110]